MFYYIATLIVHTEHKFVHNKCNFLSFN